MAEDAMKKSFADVRYREFEGLTKENVGFAFKTRGLYCSDAYKLWKISALPDACPFMTLDGYGRQKLKGYRVFPIGGNNA